MPVFEGAYLVAFTVCSVVFFVMALCCIYVTSLLQEDRRSNSYMNILLSSSADLNDNQPDNEATPEEVQPERSRPYSATRIAINVHSNEAFEGDRELEITDRHKCEGDGGG